MALRPLRVTVVLAVSASLRSPNDVAVDSAGNIFVADQTNQRIRKVTAATGFIITLAGNSAGFGGDGAAATSANLSTSFGVGVDSAGNIHVADTSNHRIRKITQPVPGRTRDWYRYGQQCTNERSSRRPRQRWRQPDHWLHGHIKPRWRHRYRYRLTHFGDGIDQWNGVYIHR